MKGGPPMKRVDEGDRSVKLVLLVFLVALNVYVWAGALR